MDDLEILLLCRVSRGAEISQDIPFMWNLKRNDTNKLTYEAETDSQTWRRNLWLPGWKGKMGDAYVHTALFKKDNQEGPTV